MKSLLTIMVFYLSCTLSGQRMLPKQKGVDIYSGFLINKSSDTYFINAGLVIFSKKGNYTLYSLEYSKNLVQYTSVKIPIENYTAEIGYSFNIWADRTKSVMINTSISAIGGYEYINKGDELLYDGAKLLNGSSLIYGVDTKFTIETYVSDHITIIASGRAKLLMKTAEDQLSLSIGAGIRINL